MTRADLPASSAMLASRSGRSAVRPGVSNDVKINDAGNANSGRKIFGASLVSAMAITKTNRVSGKVSGNAAASDAALSALCATSKTIAGKPGKYSMRPGMTSCARPRSISARDGRRLGLRRSRATSAVAALRC